MLNLPSPVNEVITPGPATPPNNKNQDDDDMVIQADNADTIMRLFEPNFNENTEDFDT